jgi:NAD+ synthase (glutamine-hydrolysing)
LTGYPPQDLLLDEAFINKAFKSLEKIASSVKNTPVILGTIRKEKDALYNTAAVLENGEVVEYRDKTHLPTYDVFDEDRYFFSSIIRKPIELSINGNKIKLGIEICEDLWDEDYKIKVSQELVQKGAEILINISASPFHINRMEERSCIIRDKIEELKCYFIYCNLVGAQDELVFDGQSCIMNPEGKFVSYLPAFKELVEVVDLENCPPIDDPKICEEEEVFQALSLGVKDYFRKTGHEQAVVGLSGGIDSALTATIAQNALGAKNVIGISMPSIYSSDHSIEDAKTLAKNLGIGFQIIPIVKINEQMLDDLSLILNGSSGLVEENLQARIRGNILMAVANKECALLLNTGNKTETALGYCTMYGDMAGALAVISDLNKSQVYEVARWVNAAAMSPYMVQYPRAVSVLFPVFRRRAHSLLATAMRIFPLMRACKFSSTKPEEPFKIRDKSSNICSLIFTMGMI